MIEEIYKIYIAQTTGAKTLVEEPGVLSGEFVLLEVTSIDEEDHIQHAII